MSCVGFSACAFDICAMAGSMLMSSCPSGLPHTGNFLPGKGAAVGADTAGAPRGAEGKPPIPILSKFLRASEGSMDFSSSSSSLTSRFSSCSASFASHSFSQSSLSSALCTAAGGSSHSRSKSSARSKPSCIKGLPLRTKPLSSLSLPSPDDHWPNFDFAPDPYSTPGKTPFRPLEKPMSMSPLKPFDGICISHTDFLADSTLSA
mmetsp:Transcript_2029/g.3239  ORF Transcript_2029/g.3239 Transcript_2029/m.3239 type:complete len:205 (-) Transcript_2029:41-655(-)